MPEYLEPGVYIEETSYRAKSIEGVSTSTAIFIDVFKKGPIRKPTLVNNFREFEDTFGGVINRSEASYGINQFFLNGGQKACVVRVRGRRQPNTRAILNGLSELPAGKQGSVDILCIPASANLTDSDMRLVYRAAIKYCEDNSAFLIIDIPKRVGQPVEVIEWVNDNHALRSRNTAVYFPWFEIDDRGNPGDDRAVGPSGTIAGVIARTDTERGVWKAPAGNDAVLHGVSGLCYDVVNQENMVLNSQGINCIRKDPDKGILCWGARTFEGYDNHQGDPEWKYVSVRRLFLYIEASIMRGTQWAVFEPNGQRLWDNLRRTAEDFLFNLWRKGALMGATIEEAYFVRCDHTTMTQEDIDKSVVIIQVGVAPLRPAEFVIFSIKQFTGDPRK